MQKSIFSLPEQDFVVHPAELPDLLLRQDLTHVARVDVGRLGHVDHVFPLRRLPVDKVGRVRGIAFDDALDFLLPGRIPVQADLDLGSRVGIFFHAPYGAENFVKWHHGLSNLQKFPLLPNPNGETMVV